MVKWFKGFYHGVVVTTILAIIGVMLAYVEIKRPVIKSTESNRKYYDYYSKRR